MIPALFWLLLTASVVFSLPYNSTVPTRECGTHQDPATIIANEQHFRAALSKVAKVGFGDQISSAAIAPFSVVWHVIAKNDSLAGGNIPDSMIQASILATNQHYTGTGISFELYKVTRTLNAAWFSGAAPGNQLEKNMKSLLHEGNAIVLNVYTVGFETESLLGYATRPIYYQLDPVNDGVMILYSTYPGGSMVPYNEGKTLTHEVGHWLGLYHPFQGGCTGDGDFVSDTPPQSERTSGCPTFQDSCPGDGVDSIHNYLDYSDDSCLNSFTPGQVVRMQESILAYRQVAT